MGALPAGTKFNSEPQPVSAGSVGTSSGDYPEPTAGHHITAFRLFAEGMCGISFQTIKTEGEGSSETRRDRPPVAAFSGG